MLVGKELAYDIEGHDVFSNVNVAISPGDKVGLIGPNGAGKTTLLHIMAGELEPTEGNVLIQDIEVGVLPQDMEDRLDQSVYDFLEDATGVKSVKEDYERAETGYNANPRDENALIVYCDAAERLGFFAVDEFDREASRSLKQAGLGEDRLEKKVGELSGGQRTRVALAAIMAAHYDVILLDEPTNNLDLEGIKILEKFIKGAKASFFMVSHDRRFLRNATNRLIELLGGAGGVNNYGLGYDEYVKARQKAYEDQLRRYEESRVAIKAMEESVRSEKTKASSAERGGSKRSDSDKLGANYRAGRAAGHLAKKAGALETRLETMRAEAPRKPQEPISLGFMFPEGEFTGRTLVNIKDAVVKYGQSDTTKEFGPYNLHLKDSDRVAIIGANGIGKSTLIKAIIGNVEIESGDRTVSENARIGYIDQDQTLPLPQKSPLANLMELAPGTPKNEAMHLLAKFNIPSESIDSVETSKLSGGERAKVLLASVAAKKANLLVLDEPTNNLDIPTIEALQEALKSYKGAMILVSHDRDFISGLRIQNTIDLKTPDTA